jgi:ribose transport system ATP-binding protein
VQRVLDLARALAAEPDLLLLDEMTAALPANLAERVLDVVRKQTESGRSVIFISHRMLEIAALCDRATVLRDGQTVGVVDVEPGAEEKIVELMLGDRIVKAEKARAAELRDDTTPTPAVAPRMRARGLRVGTKLHDASFELRPGEVLGLVALEGQGQDELFGDLAVRGGTVRLDGRPWRPRSPAGAWRGGVAYVPRERRSEGLVISRPIVENVTLPHLRRLSLGGAWLTPRRERRHAVGLGEAVRLRSTGPGQRARELSGGNQQKVVFARALGGSPRLMLLDEPTRGVDVGARFDIYSIIRDMAGRGMAVIVVSSDLPELIGISDRVAVMREGLITGIVSTTGLSEETLLNLCYGRGAEALTPTPSPSRRGGGEPSQSPETTSTTTFAAPSPPSPQRGGIEGGGDVPSTNGTRLQ